MFSRSIIAAAAALSLIVPASALYDASSSANLAMYWGQGSSQKNLSYYCDQPSVDIIPIGFVNFFPQQTSGGLPGANYGNACWLDPTYDGSDGHLYERCIWLQENIPSCQAAGKKIILSLGGGNLTYQLTGPAAGTAFATQLWQMYGPYNATYVANGGIRPLDGGYWNDKTDPNYWIDIDGFDFDIELASTDNALGYIAMLKQLRILFATNPCKKYLITGSPQCSVPDAAMDAMIQAVAFDALWVQFYNTPTCSARTWVGGNSALNTTNGKNSTAGFTYDSWVSRTALGASKNAKIYLGLLGGPAGTTALHSGDFLWPTEATNLIKTYVKDTRFGGVMLWEATVADEQFVKSGSSLVNYYTFIKSVLSPYAPKTTAASATLCPSTTSSSSSASKTSTSTTTTTTTTSKSSTTTTTSKTSSSTSASTTSSSTSSSKTSSSTSTSVSKSSSSLTSSSSSKTSSSTSSSTTSSSSSVSSSTYPTSVSSSSSSSVSSNTYPTSVSSSSSSVSSSPSSSSVSSTYSSSSSSVYSTVTPTSSSSSTSVSSTVSSSSSAVSSPTGLPSSCVFEGCWTEGNGVRALPNISYVDYTLMSEEICYDFCVTQNGYPLFGLEYGGECWCGDVLDPTSQNVTDSGDCSMPCGGTPDEFCGNGNRLDVYSCGNGAPSSSTSSQSSTSASPTSSSVSSTSQSSTVTPTSSSTSSESSSSSTTSQSSSSSAGGVTTSQSSSTSSVYPTSVSSSSSTSAQTSSSSIQSSTSSSAGVTTSQSSSTSSVYPTSVSSSSSTSAQTSSSSIQSSTSSSAGVTTSQSSSTSSVYPTSASSSSSTSVSTSSTSQSSTSSSAGVTYSPTSISSSSVYSSSSTSAPVSSSSSTISLSTGTSSPTSLSGTPSGTSSPPYQNSTTVAPTSSSSGSASSSGVVTTPSSSQSSSGVVSTPSVTSSSSGQQTTPYTTSTVYSTNIYTITSCAPTVTNCPGRLGQVTTEIISLYTTVCPVTETEGSGGETKPTSTPVAPPPASYTPYTTSTVYTTKIYTITSCAPTVTNCPAKLGQVTTEVISLYTTVCPVAEATSSPAAEATYTPAAPAIPGPGYQQSAGVEESSASTTTISSTVTQYRTVKLVKSTATVVPTPVAPYPTGPASSGGVVGTGTGLPSVSLVFIKPSPSTVAEGVTSAAGGVSATPSPSTYTGAASKMGGSMIAIVLAVIVALIV